TIYFLSSQFIYALEATESKVSQPMHLKWFYPTQFLNEREAAVLGNGTIVIAQSTLLALDPHGQFLWESQYLDLIATPAVGKDAIYAIGRHGRVHALTFDGQLKWTSEAALTPDDVDLTDKHVRLAISEVDGQEYVVLTNGLATDTTIKFTKVVAINTATKVATTVPVADGQILPQPTVTQDGDVLFTGMDLVWRWHLSTNTFDSYDHGTGLQMMVPALLGANGDLVLIMRGGEIYSFKNKPVIILP
ncbi:MAG: hypothetical protein KC609_03100, partial [Myxococcales bacterium]|nr:hypothetical protein [Myxococcales bacterium]